MKEIKDRLQEALRIRNITRSELSERSGVPKPMITDYIKGRYKPKQERLYALAQALDVSPYWLMGHDVDINFKGFVLDYSYLDEDIDAQDFTSTETEHIKKYRFLDEYGKKVVDNVINIEYERCTTPKNKESFDQGDKDIEALLDMLKKLKEKNASKEDEEKLSVLLKNLGLFSDFEIVLRKDAKKHSGEGEM